MSVTRISLDAGWAALSVTFPGLSRSTIEQTIEVSNEWHCFDIQWKRDSNVSLHWDVASHSRLGHTFMSRDPMCLEFKES